MVKIKANASGTRSIEVSEKHLLTLAQYQLLEGLIDSSGYIDDQSLDKLRFNIRAILGSSQNKNDSLLDLCLDVIYHKDMKVFGLRELVNLYSSWKEDKKSDDELTSTTNQ